MNTSQVRISNTVGSSNTPRVLSIKASRLSDYIYQLIQEANHVYTPNRSKEFEYMPLVSFYDLADTKEEVYFQSVADLPKESVFNSKGEPLLIIIPESEDEEIGLNKFEHLDPKDKEKIEKHLRDISNKKK